MAGNNPPAPSADNASMPREGDAPPRRRRPWWRRPFRIAGILALTVAFFIAVLPAILSWLPLEGVVERQLSGMIGGEVQLEGLRVGWLAPVSLSSITLRDGRLPASDPASEFLRLEGLRVGGGLFPLLTGSQRPGKISTEHLALHAARMEDGSFNFQAFLPAGTSAPADTPPAAERQPFVLGMETLIPMIALPVGNLSLDFRLAGLDATWEDRLEGSPLKRLELSGAGIEAKWDGGSAPLTFESFGALKSEHGETTFHAAGTVNDWTDGRAIRRTPDTAIDAGLTLGDGVEALTIEVGEREGRFGLSARVPLASWKPVLALFALEEFAPTSGGAAFNLSIGRTADHHVPLEILFQVENVALPGIGDEGGGHPLPPMDFSLEGAFHESTFLPRTLSSRLDAGPLSFSAQAHPLEETPEKSLLAALAHMDLAAMAAMMEDARLAGLLPASSDGSMTFEFWAVVEEASRVTDGGLDLVIDPGVLTFTEGHAESLPLRRAGTLDARPLALALSVFDLKLGQHGQDAIIEIATVGDQRVPLSFGGAFSRHEDGKLAGEFSGRFTPGDLISWLDETMTVLPPLEVEGDIHLDAAFHHSPGGSEFNLVLAAADLATSSPLIPGGRYADQLEFVLDGGRGASGEMTGDYSLAGNYLHLEGDFEHDGLLLTRSGHRVRLHDLKRLDQDFLAFYTPDGLLEASGEYTVSLSLEQPEAAEWRMGWNGVSGQDFGLHFPAHSLMFGEGDLLTSGALHATLEDGIRARIEKGRIHIGPEAELDFSLQVNQASEGIDFQGQQLMVVHHGALLDRLDGTLQGFGVLLEVMDGRTRVEGSLSGNMVMGDSMELDLQQVLTLDNGIDRLHLAAPVPITLERFHQKREIAAWIGLASEGVRYTIKDAGVASLGLAMVGDEMMGADLVLESAADYQETGDLDLRLHEVGWEAIDVTIPGGDFLFLPASTISGRLLLEEFGRRVQAEEFSVNLWNQMEGSLSAALDRNAGEVAFETAGAIHDLAAINRLLGDMVPARLAGAVEGDARGNFILDRGGEGRIPLRRWLADVDVTWTDFGAAMEGLSLGETNGTLRFHADPSQVWLRSDSWGHLHSASAAAGEIDTDVTYRAAFAMERLEGTRIEDRAAILLEEFSLSLPGLGTELLLEGGIDEVHFASPPPNRGEASRLEGLADAPLLLNRLPGWLSIVYSQDVAALGFLPGLDAPAGEVGLRFDYRLARDVRGDLSQEATARGLSLRWSDWVLVEGLSADLPFRKTFFLPGIPAAAPSPNRGALAFDLAAMDIAGMDIRAEKARVEIHEDQGLVSLRSRVESLLGGTFSMDARIEERLGVTSLVGDFALTGLDAAIVFPALDRELARLREVDAFGVIRVPYRLQVDEAIRGEGLRPFQLLEDLSVHLDINRIEAEVLRGALRTMNSQGDFPAAQAVLAALQFSRPSSVEIDIRSGLLDVAVDMVTPGGLRYRIPLVERLHVGEYMRTNLDATSRMTSELLMVFLVDTLLSLQENL